MVKLDPTAYDRWWRARIQREESTYVDKAQTEGTPKKTIAVLNTLGAPQVMDVPAAHDHLVGGGALVRKAHGTAPPSGLVTGPSGTKAPSVAGSRASLARRKGDDTRSVASGADSPKTTASYPRTPQFSAAGASGAGTEIVSRLARLERELQEEKRLREIAEKEMKEILSKTVTPATGGGGAVMLRAPPVPPKAAAH